MIAVLLATLIGFAPVDSANGMRFYYHHKDRLYADGKEVKVNVDGVEYSLAWGCVSPHGTYVSGVLFTEELQNRNKARQKGGIAHFNSDVEIIYGAFYRETGIPLFMDRGADPWTAFSPNEKFLVYGNQWDGFSVVKCDEADFIY